MDDLGIPTFTDLEKSGQYPHSFCEDEITTGNHSLSDHSHENNENNNEPGNKTFFTRNRTSNNRITNSKSRKSTRGGTR